MLTLAFGPDRLVESRSSGCGHRGDNGILSIWPEQWAASPSHFYWLSLAVSTLASCPPHHRVFAVPALRCVRHAIRPLRSEAIGITASGSSERLRDRRHRRRSRRALFAYLKGSVFPDKYGHLAFGPMRWSWCWLVASRRCRRGGRCDCVQALNIWLSARPNLPSSSARGFRRADRGRFPKGICRTLEAIMYRRRKSASSAAPLLTSRIETAE